MAISDSIKKAINSAEISTRDWWNTRNPIDPANQAMVDKYGIEVTLPGDIDKYNDSFIVDIHNNEAGRHIKGITFDEKKVIVHYDGGRADQSIPLKLDRLDFGEHKGRLTFHQTDFNVYSAEPRTGNLTFNVAMPGNAEKSFTGLDKQPRLFLRGDNWPSQVIVDVAKATTPTSIVNEGSANINVVGATAVQRESVERESLANDGKRPLTLENNSSGSVTLGNPGNSVKITLDEISQDHKPTAVQTPPTGAAKTTDSIKR